jgi:hypothetical protein
VTFDDALHAADALRAAAGAIRIANLDEIRGLRDGAEAATRGVSPEP